MSFSKINNFSFETPKSKNYSFDIDKRAEVSERQEAKDNEIFDVDKRAETTKDDSHVSDNSPDVEQNQNYSEENKQTDMDNEGNDSKRSENIEKNIEDYINDIKNHSEFPDTLDNVEIKPEEVKKISPEENAGMHEEFSDKKAEMKRQWEEKNGIPWPKYEEDVYSANGKLIRRKGDDYDAHHIQPLGLGGKNVPENITPMHASEHYDKQGVHAPNSPYDKLQNSVI